MNRLSLVPALLLTLALLFCALPTAALAETPPLPVTLPLLGQAAGSNDAVVTDGQVAYLAKGSRILAFDVRDPLHPRQIGQSPVLPGVVYRLALAGGRLYAPVSPALLIYDVTDPAALREIGRWSRPTPGEPIFDVEPRGNYAYLATGQGVRVIDVSDPTLPVSVGFVAGPVGFYLAATPEPGGPVYVGGNDALHVVDVSDPLNPTKAATLKVGGYIWSVAALDRFVYVGTSNEQVNIVDATVPAAPKQVATRSVRGAVIALTAVPGKLYAGVAERGVLQFDNSDPANPILIAEAPVPSYATGIAVWPDGLRVAVSDTKHGVRFFTNQSGKLKALSGLDIYGECRNVAVARSVAVCINGWRGAVGAFDISDPARVRPLGMDAAPIDAEVIAAGGERVYVPDGPSALQRSLHTYRVGNGGQFEKMGVAPSFTLAEAIAADGVLVYVLDVQALQIFDATNPSALVKVGQYASPNWDGLALAPGRAYLYNAGAENQSDWIEILDVSDPAHPQLARTLGGPSGRVAAKGTRLYVAGAGRLKAYDVTNPAAPVLQDDIALTPLPDDMIASGRHLYVVFQNHGVKVFDTEQGLAQLATVEDAGFPFGADVGSGRLVVASGNKGFLIYPSLWDKTYAPAIAR